MKKQLLIGTIILFLPILAMSQHDVKINISNAILYEINMSYEYVATENFSISAFGGYVYGFPDQDDRSQYAYIGPEFRYYVSPKNGGDRFFIGVYSRYKNGMVGGYVQESGELISTGNYDYLTTSVEQDFNKISIGFMLGSKWAMSNGFVFGFFGGFGRNLMSSYSEANLNPHQSLFVPGTYSSYYNTSSTDSKYWDFRIGFNIGYRFGR